MSKCVNCKNTQYLDLECKYCNKKFCTKCLMYEVHGCSAFLDMKTVQRKNLQDKLFKEQVKEVKVSKI